MKETFNLDDSSSLGTSIRERFVDGAQETSGCVPLMFLGTHCSREREQHLPWGVKKRQKYSITNGPRVSHRVK